MIHATTALALRKLKADYYRLPRRLRTDVYTQCYRVEKSEIINNFVEVVADAAQKISR